MANDEPVLVITGASTGIGAATARRAVEFGNRVVLAARSEDKLSALADELGGEDRALAVRCDVTSWEDQQALVQAALERFGRMDSYFANAGFGAKRGFLEESIEHWKSMIDTNVLGAALSIRASLGRFKEQNSGHLILTSSIAGRRALPGSLYSATKHAVTAMGEALRHADRTRDGRHAVLRQQCERRPRGRRHRPRRHVRAHTAASRGCERDADSTHPPAHVTSSA
jgi:NADP-dependent 3-hydroxy acid dehydrogenase YdfG